MNFKLQKPDMLQECQLQQKGYNIFLESLLFVGIFFISQIVMGILSGIPMAVYVVSSGILNQAENLLDLQNRLMSVSMRISLVLQLPGIFLVILLCRWFQNRKAWTLGFKKRNILREYGIGMGAGFLMMTVIVLLGWVTGALSIRLNPQPVRLGTILLLLFYFAGFLFQGMFEEVLCRGYFLLSLSRRKGNLWVGILGSSLVFSALHLANPGINVLSLCNLTLFGIFAGVYFIKRGDLWGIGALHSLWNFTQGNVWGVLVSGMRTEPSVFLTEAKEGLELVNGGSFGLEGGILTTAVLIAGTLILLRLPQKDPADASADPLSVPQA